ncbi:aromatic acid exporter family protein [Pseudonocardia adelaidensis]|uniref:FUSC family protein n=1 Tax=Pseudonocardia adelaidensis TaxID=648754 RepID=UPI0031E52F2E
MSNLWERWRLLCRPSREREIVVQSVKAALAAGAALGLTQPWAGSHAFLAPYAAVLAVTSTVRGSWTGAARQAGTVLAGVVLAYVVSTLVPVGTAAVPVVVVLGLLAGRWRQFGPDGWWIAITGLIVVLNGAASNALDLAGWVALSLCGSVAGALVNTLLLPPVHLRDARDAVTALTAEVAATLRDMAGSVRDGWSTADASRWVDGARGLRHAVRVADDAVWYGRESARWNPRRRHIRRFDSPLAGRDVVNRLSRVCEGVLQVSVLLANVAAPDDSVSGDPELANLLERLADAVEVLAEDPNELAAALDVHGAEVRRLRDGAGEQAARGACVIAVSDAVSELEAVTR